MISWLIKKILGTKNQRELKKLLPLVDEINRIEASYRQLSDEALQAKTIEFRERLGRGETLDQLLPEAFAAVKNTCRRFTEQKRVLLVRGQQVLWEMIPFDVQLVGGMALHRGRIAEMATGEGKTLVATLPTYLNALSGRGVHVVTVNDYLAARDAEWMGEIYRFLGLSVGCIQHDQSPAIKREQYAMDITYGTNTEFGFDYLRDNGMATRAEDQVQRGHYYAIVDEVDSILIDEARTPLIISGPSTVNTNLHFDRYKPAIERLVREQTRIANQFASQAIEAAGREAYEEAAALLYRVKIATPRNRQLLKAMEDPELRKALEDFETNLYADTRREELYRLKEEVLFTLDERHSECDLSAKGREFLSPNDPDAFVVPDILTALHDINSATDLSPTEREKRRDQAQQRYNDANERIHTISQLLRAYSTLEKDVHYVVQENKIMIVDEYTGRILPGRRWSDGLHGAVEAKEGVTVDRETQTLATITIQNYFRLYEKLAGMTGTAETEANEFHDIYRLDVMVIPPNRICKREDFNDAVYKTRREKYNAVVREIKTRHGMGQPLLIGTASVESSEVLSRMLKREAIPHSVLNAKFHQMEAEIVARAGQKSSVTIATNMAGRGTDIKLGPSIADLGGLCVIGTERHESRRIDRQLRGRCARQGDPGVSKFFVSFEDDLMRNFADSRKLAEWMSRLGMKDDEELEHPWLNKSVENAQKRVEQRNYSIRRHTLQYDDVMNQQRTVVYEFRNEVLHTDNPRQRVFDVVEEVVQDQAALVFKNPAAPEFEPFLDWAATAFPLQLDEAAVRACRDPESLARILMENVHQSYDLKTKFEDPAASRQLERYMILNAVDRLWQEHLYAMDGLRTSIGLRAYGQKDPLIEFKSEAFVMFEDLMTRIKLEIASSLFRSTASLTAFENFLAALPQKFIHEQLPGLAAAMGAAQESAAPMAHPDAPAPSAEERDAESSKAIAEALAPARRQLPKVGRNDPCPCGSGKKFKNCCGKEE
jgi:preprotein translocase subunit SecA